MTRLSFFVEGQTEQGYVTPVLMPHLELILMQAALRLETTILPGHRLEISDPQLPEGARVEVIVVLPAKPQPQFGSALEFLESLPPGPRAFKTWEEYEQHLREENDAWDR